MSNKYCNLSGADKISETFQRINDGFASVETDIDDTKETIEKIDQRVDGLVNNPDPNKDLELVDLRTSNIYGVFPTAKARLDYTDNLFSSHLEESATQFALKADKTEINNLAAVKADKTYVDTLAASLASGSPKGVYATVADLNNAFPAGNTNIYLVTADGKWYYWSGSAWTAGGTYQSTGLADKSVDWKHLNTMQPFIYPYPRHSLVIEQDASYNLYVKCSNIYVRNIPGPREYSWSAIMSQLPDNVATSPSGVENCLKITEGDALVFNVVNKKFEIGEWNKISPQQIKLVMANEEDLSGEFINRHFFRTINNRLSTLETAASNFNLPDKSVDWKHLNTMQPFIYPYPRHSLVIEQDASYNLYVKCSNIYVRNIPGPREYSWSAIMSQLPDNVATSPSGVENCLKITEGDALVFNVVNKKFEIGEWNKISPQQIKLVMANEEDLSGEFINRHFFRTINNRLSTLDNRLSTLETAASNGIPEYWKTELATKIARIKEKQLEANTFSVAFITDIHYPTNYMQSPKLLAEVIKRCDIPYFYNGGDEVNQASTRAESLARHRAVMNAFKDVGIIDRMLMCIGNHDDNTQGSAGNIPENIALRPEMVYSEMVRHGETSYMIKSSANKLYSYADNEAQKVRFIALNGHDAVFKVDKNNNVVDSGYMTASYRQEQIDWLINVALDLPDDSWSVVIGSHASGMTNDFWGNAKNKDIVIGILNAFNNKTTFSKSNTHADPDYNVSVDVDFTNSGGEVICWIGGHMHEDRIGVVPGTTIPAIDVESDSYQEPSAVSVPKVKGTTTEQAFDIFTFNKDTRTCYITRIGAGADRQFNY